jgi:hypothetical protein
MSRPKLPARHSLERGHKQRGFAATYHTKCHALLEHNTTLCFVPSTLQQFFLRFPKSAMPPTISTCHGVMESSKCHLLLSFSLGRWFRSRRINAALICPGEAGSMMAKVLAGNKREVLVFGLSATGGLLRFPFGCRGTTYRVHSLKAIDRCRPPSKSHSRDK